MLFQGRFTNEWRAGEKRENKFVFIGRNLPTERLQTEFDQLYARGELRFPVGTRVLANVGEFVPATVIKHWDEGYAYRLQLDTPKNADGDDEVWGLDEDDYVKALAP